MERHRPARASDSGDAVTARDDAELARVVAAATGEPVAASERARWGFANRTDLVTTASGRRLAVVRTATAVAARSRLRASALDDRLRAAGVPVPRLVAADPDAAPPYVVSELVEGATGGELLGDPVDTIALATEMGRLVTRIAGIDVATARDAGLATAWAEPTTLAVAAAGWLQAARPVLDGETAAEAARLVGRVEPALAGRPAVLAHGYFVPVNAIVLDRSVVGLVDWEDARIADPLLDPAWWLWVVWHHHRERYAAAAPALLETAGVELDAATVERMRVLVAARQLETLAARPAGDDAGRGRWARRLRELLAADD